MDAFGLSDWSRRRSRRRRGHIFFFGYTNHRSNSSESYRLCFTKRRKVNLFKLSQHRWLAAQLFYIGKTLRLHHILSTFCLLIIVIRHGQECMLHEGSTVKKGTKYVLRSDLMFSAWVRSATRIAFVPQFTANYRSINFTLLARNYN